MFTEEYHRLSAYDACSHQRLGDALRHLVFGDRHTEFCGVNPLVGVTLTRRGLRDSIGPERHTTNL